MPRQHRLLPFVSATVALLLGACGTGQQLATGPVFGYASGRGASIGWEAGGGPMWTAYSGYEATPSLASLLARFNAGVSWRPTSQGSQGHERITYAVWEPWFLLGGTLGVAHSSEGSSVGPMFGVWEAAPYILGSPIRRNPLSTCSPCYTVSLAFGWRWSSGTGEFYLAPKFGILNDVAMPFPFQRYAD